MKQNLNPNSKRVMLTCTVFLKRRTKIMRREIADPIKGRKKQKQRLKREPSVRCLCVRPVLSCLPRTLIFPLRFGNNTAHPHESSLPAYIPCAHPGTCESSGMCNCVERNHKCTEYCHCPLNCKNRYEGCSCKECDADCSCIRSNRECGKYCRCVKDMLGCCRNMALQMGLAKRVYIDVSTLPNAGYGLFVDENVKKNEFVGEYIGEKISTTEGDRREKLNAAYLFGLNEDYLIDASTQGGMFRFANDGNEKLNNIQPLIMLAGGEHRIGFYAKREIKKGEELFFDYGPHFKRTLLNSSSSASKKQSKNNNGYGGKSDKRENKRNGKKELLRVKGLHGTLRY
ncbi:hypothetical protein BKA69DRAFT_364476 [Paraphysoderma sedebokerense]|nr:hypothetical protein BKA69DRAFT_364476 [Paraphysoderma sedebokerense]